MISRISIAALPVRLNTAERVSVKQKLNENSFMKYHKIPYLKWMQSLILQVTSIICGVMIHSN
jgi:hypothetical protein